MERLTTITMLRLIRGIIALSILGLSFSSQAAERKVVEIIQVNSDVKFSINTNRSAVRITTADTDKVKITATITHQSEKVTEEVEIRITQSRGHVSVEKLYYREPLLVDIASWFKLNDWKIPEIEYDIVLPIDASLHIDSNRADLYVEAPAGRIEISSYDGESIITGIRNDLVLDTYTGNITIEVQELNDISIGSRRGDVEINIAQANNYTLRAKTRNGNLNIQGIDVIVQQDGSHTFMSRRVGDGSNLIEVDGGRGNVTVRLQD